MTAVEELRAAVAALRAGQVTTVTRDELADLIAAVADDLEIRAKIWAACEQNTTGLAEVLYRHPLAVARAVIAGVRA